MSYRFWIQSLLFAATLVFAGCQTIIPPSRTQRVDVTDKALEGLPEDSDQNFVQKIEFPIGLLIPLTGNDANIGHNLYEAAKLALFNTTHHRITLLPFDTKSSDDGAAQAFGRALEKNVRVVIGPLRSSELTAIKGRAHHNKIPVIAFTNDINIADNGIFVFGFSSHEQIKRLFQYTFKQGIRTCIAILPKNQIGDHFLKEIERIQKDGLVKIFDVLQYDPHSQKHIEELAALKEKSYEAIFIPEGGTNLKTILSSLLFHGINIKNTKILGTGQWIDQDTRQMPALQGAWFVAPSVSGFEKFTNLYFHAYKKYPLRLSSLAFDAVQMVAALSKNTKAENPFVLPLFCKERGFLGIDGLFRLNENGDTERGLAIYTILNDQIVTLESAPRDFRD